MINRFALSFLCIELDRNEIFGFTGLYILLLYRRDIVQLAVLMMVILHFKSLLNEAQLDLSYQSATAE